MRLATVDVSETGARVRTTCCLPHGMTGTALEIVSDHDEAPEPACMGASSRGSARVDGELPLTRIPIGRSVTVVWSRAIRRDDGRLDHYEAGLRFF